MMVSPSGRFFKSILNVSKLDISTLWIAKLPLFSDIKTLFGEKVDRKGLNSQVGVLELLVSGKILVIHGKALKGCSLLWFRIYDLCLNILPEGRTWGKRARRKRVEAR